MTWRASLVVALAGAGCFRGADACAQSAAGPEPGRFEVAAGPLWMGAVSVGSRDAILTTPSGGSFRLFSTSSELGQASGAEVSVGTRMTRSVHAEVVVSYAASRLRTTIASDVEGVGSVTASEPIQQFTFEGAATVDLPRWRLSSRMSPFISAGAGYLRQLHESRTLVQTGRMYRVGGGVKYVLVSRTDGRSRLKQVGIRAEARAYVRTGGTALDGGTHTAPAVTAALFALF